MMVALSASAAAQEESEEPAASEDEEGAPEWSFESIFDGSNSWGDLTFNFAADAVEVDWSGITLNADASRAARAVADGAMSGEKDGVVSDDEFDSFKSALQALLENEFGKWANNHAFSGFVLIDQAEAQEAEVSKLDATGMTGPVDAETPVTASFAIRVGFPNVDDYKDIHTVRVDFGDYYLTQPSEGDTERFAGDLTLTLTGMDDWTLDPASVHPECASAGYADGKLVYEGEDASCFTGKSGVVLVFAITGEGKQSSNFLPSLQLLGAISALGAAVALRRRL
jgi:hypothetical protein